MPQYDDTVMQPAGSGFDAEQLYIDAYPDEGECIKQLIHIAGLSEVQRDSISKRAAELIRKIRQRPDEFSLLEKFLSEYSLSQQEGVVLMCLAEAMLRIPDNDTRDRLIEGKLTAADWFDHLGHSDSILVNASTFGLMLSGTLLGGHDGDHGLAGTLQELVAKLSEPIIREATLAAMRILGDQFVLGENIGQALQRIGPYVAAGYSFSFDMLGEAAVTLEESRQHFDSYTSVIEVIGPANTCEDITRANGVSVKLSALHPRFEALHRESVVPVVFEQLLELCVLCRQHGIGLTIDTEECARLEITLEVFRRLAEHDSLRDWQGLGIAVQTYHKRAQAVLGYIREIARNNRRRIMLRLVKGAYWDSEIKWAQEKGFSDYPVFTRKRHTDISYMAGVKYLSRYPEYFYPMYATHNAHTLCAIQEISGQSGYEFQRLQGMGESLYGQLMTEGRLAVPCRIYAPVGSHDQLLPYLVRRLLENGSNSSFINRIHDETVPAEQLATDPVSLSESVSGSRNTVIPLPEAIYGEERINSSGMDLSLSATREALQSGLLQLAERKWSAHPLIDGEPVQDADTDPVINPANHGDIVGQVTYADEVQANRAFEVAQTGVDDWAGLPVAERAERLVNAGNRLEENRFELISLLQREAGKTIEDAISEVREAIDFCRYYAAQANMLLSVPEELPGITGEQNQLSCHARGVFVCISPWNFPLAIFTGQIAAALVTGNSVIAKPASSTPLVAYQVVRIFHECGVPKNSLQYVPASGAVTSNTLLSQTGLSGVVFTGSIETARAIQGRLASRESTVAAFIAETGGINAMIADSSALLEQVVRDVIRSAFYSAGQRCSAARVLYVQDDVAEQLIDKLTGAMRELVTGDPGSFSTDVGPIINSDALEKLRRYERWLDSRAKLLYRCELDNSHARGSFLAPVLYEISGIEILPGEAFGPVLHVARFRAGELDQVVHSINKAGYGLTLSLHSRIDRHIRYVCEHARIGNIYVNRNQVGAVVGSQPFGGENLSGTGPKAGGPNYLRRFVTERTTTINTAAIGGNLDLLT